ncbi:MAG: DUF1156 domain-containing protein, partial [Planctomycetes bacterium]|nr:DUF1156 domain-containing protein [Planctomycetota bacterium]
SRAAILASLLPAYPNGDESIRPWPKKFLTKFATEDAYHAWFLKLIGINGDPVAGRKLIQWAKTKGIKLKVHPYGYDRAFTVNPTEDQLETLYDLLEWTWGTREITFCDPMSGGGSIPFEALRYGLTVHANELNPVASVILKATLDYPARFGPSLADDIRKYGKMWCDKVRERLEPFYPLSEPNENIFAYLWARTVACPVTGKPVPLSPNWWLRKGSDPIAVKVIADTKEDRCRFEIVKGKTACEKAKPDQGTIKRGTGRSCWTGEAIPNEQIKAAAQSGRMGAELVAVGIKARGGLKFRAPVPSDHDAITRFQSAASVRMTEWEKSNLLPDEALPLNTETWTHGNTPAQYDSKSFRDLFTDRQLYSLCLAVEEFLGITEKVFQQVDKDKAEAIQTYLALAIDKAVDYNSKQTVYDVTRNKIAHAFARHDIGLRWSFAEFDASRNLFSWSLEQVIDAVKSLSSLLGEGVPFFFTESRIPRPVERLGISQGSAADLQGIETGTLHVITVDPPYYDNVNYAELSDFFYVWLRRTLGGLLPDFFRDSLSNKEDEAVANPARFMHIPKKKKALAIADYENKMKVCFQEMYRTLASDGVLTVMFTHKQVEAWDTLGIALLHAGFRIHASWPVHTESEVSLHQAKKNAAASTIMLVCRKREQSGEPVWWDDLKGRVRQTARESAERFEQMGIAGVDLYISTFGPVLSIISENWPVLTSQTDPKTGDPMPLRPGDALDLARAEVIALRKQGLLLGRAVDFDPVTDWVLMAWDAFKAAEFPADEARKLALALGLDLEVTIVREKKLVAKKQSTVVLNEPKARRKKGMVDPDAESFAQTIDAVHTAMMVYDEDGAKACGVFLAKHGLKNDSRFKACIEALMKAIPTTRDKKGAFIRPEMQTLEALRLAFFEDLPAPKEEEVPKVEEQKTLFTMDGGDEDVDEDEDEEGDQE